MVSEDEVISLAISDVDEDFLLLLSVLEDKVQPLLLPNVFNPHQSGPRELVVQLQRIANVFLQLGHSVASHVNPLQKLSSCHALAIN